MKNYLVNATKPTRYMLLQGETNCGALEYKHWFSHRAEIICADQPVIHVESKGFPGARIEIKQYGELLIDYRMNWKAEILIHARFNYTDSYYTLKKMGAFKSLFTFYDNDKQELIQLKRVFKLKYLRYNYEIATTDRFESSSQKLLLLFTAIHATNYYIAFKAAAV